MHTTIGATQLLTAVNTTNCYNLKIPTSTNTFTQVKSDEKKKHDICTTSESRDVNWSWVDEQNTHKHTDREKQQACWMFAEKYLNHNLFLSLSLSFFVCTETTDAGIQCQCECYPPHKYIKLLMFVHLPLRPIVWRIRNFHESNGNIYLNPFCWNCHRKHRPHIQENHARVVVYFLLFLLYLSLLQLGFGYRHKESSISLATDSRCFNENKYAFRMKLSDKIWYNVTMAQQFMNSKQLDWMSSFHSPLISIWNDLDATKNTLKTFSKSIFQSWYRHCTF